MRVSLGQRLMRAAAVLALLLAAMVGWQQFSTPTASEVIVSAENAGHQSVGLPDGSHIWLREGSHLAYAEKWSGKERRVKLHGEGYFEVAHDPAHPFKVELENGGSVEVLGTQFDVRQTADETTVLVRSGKVRFSPTAQTAGPVLTANQKAVFDHAAAQLRVSNLSSLNELSWQTGGLEFVNTPLNHVVSDLERYYGVTIALRNPAMSNCPHSAPLTSQPIEKVLETLALTHQLKVKKLGERSYELIGGQCR
jgi:ferric-dicitrate binding protein FerR (iron transport regulator)